mgnify:FL=1
MSYFGQSVENENFNALVPIERFYPDLAPNTVSNATSESSSEPLFQGTRILYWYHPDYVSNVDLVTDVNGEAYELFLYNAWGESLHHWTSNSSNSWSSPYRFNSKELDPETGMHYYGARYHHPKLSVWMSVDRFSHYYPNKSPYNFIENNPLLYVDPTGDTTGINLFAITESSTFHDVAENQIKNPTNDGVFVIYGHANSSGIPYYDENGNKKTVYTGEAFNRAMAALSEEYAEALNNGTIKTIIIYGCNTDSEEYVSSQSGKTIKREKTIAEKISEANPDVEVVAANGFVWYGQGKILGVSQQTESEPAGTGNGGFHTIINGVRKFFKKFNYDSTTRKTTKKKKKKVK